MNGSIRRTVISAAALLALLVAITGTEMMVAPDKAAADPLVGALGGAVIGGIVGRGGGAVAGAIIGGVVGGAIEHERRRRGHRRS